MNESGRISILQLAILFYITIVATAILLVPAITGQIAKRDLWLSPIWGSITGFLVIYISFQLHKSYPDMTFIEYLEEIVGKVLGKIIAFVYLFFLLQSNAIIIREYAEFVIGNFLFTTPMIIVVSSLVLVSALAVHGGLEVVARSAQMIIPVFVILFVLIVILLLPDMDPKNMLPIMEHGVLPSLKGAKLLLEWFSQFFLIAFILPYIKEDKKKITWMFSACIVAMLTLVISNIVSLFILGGITADFTYPFLAAARFINVAEFIQHVEAIVMAIWVAGIFVKISIYYYITVLGTSQWLRISNYQLLVLPFGFLFIIFTMWTANSLQELTKFIDTSWYKFGFIMQVIIPVILLFIAIVKKKNKDQSNRKIRQ